MSATRMNRLALRSPAVSTNGPMLAAQRPQHHALLRDACRRWLLELRADHRPGSTATVTAAAARAPDVLRSLDRLLHARSLVQGLEVHDGSGSTVAASMRWRADIASGLLAHQASLAGRLPQADCTVFGHPAAPAHLQWLLVEHMLARLALPPAAHAWLLGQVAPLLQALGRILDEPSPAVRDGSETAAVGNPASACAPRSLAERWLQAHCSGVAIPFALRLALPRLTAPIAALAERDPSFWHCVQHPARRLLRDWLATLHLRQLRGESHDASSEEEVTIMAGMLEAFGAQPFAAAAVHPTLLASRALQDAGVLAHWYAQQADPERAVNDANWNGARLLAGIFGPPSAPVFLR